MLKRPSKQDYVSAEHYARALQIYIDVKESALQSQIDRLQTQLSGITQYGSVEAAEKIDRLTRELYQARIAAEDCRTQSNLAYTSYKFPWEDKTDE